MTVPNSHLTDPGGEVARHLAAGRLQTAEEICLRSLAAMPDEPGALLTLGQVLAAQTRWREAEAVWRHGRARHPSLVGFPAALGRLYVHLQRLSEAVEPLEDCVLMDPSVRDHKTTLVALYQSRRFASFSEDSKRAMIACLADEALAHDLMQGAWLSLLRLDPSARDLLALFDGPDFEAFSRRVTPALLSIWEEHRLLTAGMERFFVTDPAMERGLTFARKWFFEERAEGKLSLTLLCSLARYCFLTEYVFVAVEDHSSLRQSLRTAADVALLACYEPLHGVDGIDRLSRYSDAPCYRRLLEVQLEEPEQELALRREIQAPSSIEDEVSQAVEAQYEESPYPRWATVGGNVSLPESVLSRARDKRILVAGCGTGREAIEAALIFPASQVDAIDLSRTSLAYGLRKARALGVQNLSFAQIDLLELPRLGTTYDLIVCSGVLHHMANPTAGLMSLVDVLRPNGVLRVALYSSVGRAVITEARALAKREGFPATKDGVRAFRLAIMSRPENDAVRKKLTGSYDFYSTSGCRDLVFHAHERTFTLIEVAVMVDALDLKVLKVDSQPLFLRAFRERFGEKTDTTNLSRWHTLEQERPAMFSSLFSLWLGRASESESTDFGWIQETGRM
jgi:SAM-dependent methyltransferase